ncbi:hypothetical protein Syun_014150 [Stephania yunnanensis]|uniref:Pectin acetylesterase n=1 Tax=Stephania yunnanensis TaxID=152371 RepID=A0AAP0JKX4_9MAGN
MAHPEGSRIYVGHPRCVATRMPRVKCNFTHIRVGVDDVVKEDAQWNFLKIEQSKRSHRIRRHLGHAILLVEKAQKFYMEQLRCIDGEATGSRQQAMSHHRTLWHQHSGSDMCHELIGRAANMESDDWLRRCSTSNAVSSACPSYASWLLSNTSFTAQCVTRGRSSGTYSLHVNTPFHIVFHPEFNSAFRYLVGWHGRVDGSGNAQVLTGFSFPIESILASLHFIALLSRCSAGGLVSILHCDEFRELFPATIKMKCLSDAGLFLDA